MRMHGQYARSILLHDALRARMLEREKSTIIGEIGRKSANLPRKSCNLYGTQRFCWNT